jgi:hypothetical protein
MFFRTRSGYQASPRQLGELHAGAKWPRDIVQRRLAYCETLLVRIQIDSLEVVVIAAVGGELALRWRGHESLH